MQGQPRNCICHALEDAKRGGAYHLIAVQVTEKVIGIPNV